MDYIYLYLYIYVYTVCKWVKPSTDVTEEIISNEHENMRPLDKLLLMKMLEGWREKP